MCLGFPVTPDLARRSRLAQLLAGLVYLGIPLVFLALTLWISSAEDSETFHWQPALVPLVLLVAGWYFRRRNQYKPGNWSAAGMWMGLITGFFATAYTTVLDGPVALALPAGFAGAIVGVALGKYAERVLMRPAIPELADSPYELTFRVRGLTRLRMVIGDSSVNLRESRTVRTLPNSDQLGNGYTYPFTELKEIHDVSLSGVERLKFPEVLRLAPSSTPGPAVILQAKGGDWVLPQNEAPAVAQILNRRMAAS